VKKSNCLRPAFEFIMRPRSGLFSLSPRERVGVREDRLTLKNSPSPCPIPPKDGERKKQALAK
jgi:hypothetical protein